MKVLLFSIVAFVTATTIYFNRPDLALITLVAGIYVEQIVKK